MMFFFSLSACDSSETRRINGNLPDSSIDDSAEVDTGDPFADSDDRKQTFNYDAGPQMILCDGSDQIRFAYSASGGFLSPDDLFLSPFAYHYFVVRGDCSYIVSDRPSGEVRTRELDQDRSARLSTEVGFEKIAARSAFEDVESCPDAGAITLQTSTLRIPARSIRLAENYLV